MFKRNHFVEISLIFTFFVSNLKTFYYEKKVIQKQIHPVSVEAMEQLVKVMTVGHYAKRSIQNYLRELRFIAEYYPDVALPDLTENLINDYIVFIKVNFNVGRDKCRMVASALSFYFKTVVRKPYILPVKLYPKKSQHIPNIMSVDEVMTLLEASPTHQFLRPRAILEVFYSTGVRLEEFTFLKVTDIDSKNNCIHLRHGKGGKERKLLLSPRCLATLRLYYRKYKPVDWLFEAQNTPGKRLHPRSLQWSLARCFERAGMKDKEYSAHTFRHSFATHMLDAGCDLHTIKELLGHSKIETTMIYLHLQSKKRLSLISPLDALFEKNELLMADLQTPVL